ncbi:MAG: outer membrane beta-barrel protein [Pseudomonadota bacterium]
MKTLLVGASMLLTSTTVAAAEAQISVYGGYQTAPQSNVTISGAFNQRFNAAWEGKPFAMPPYYGVRGTWWLPQHEAFGVSLDFTHAKVYGTAATLAANGLREFEFTDGLNTITLNGLYRFDQKLAGFRPYVGAGLGVNVPYVEVDRIAAPGATNGYQVGGISAQALAGLEFDITERVSAFTEYKFNYNRVNVNVDGGDRLSTTILTNAINIGLSFRF